MHRSRVDRRQLLKAAGAPAMAGAAFPVPMRAAVGGARRYGTRAVELVTGNLVIDIMRARGRLKAGYESYAFREEIDIDGFDHPQKVFDLTEELIRRRCSDADIALVLGGEFPPPARGGVARASRRATTGRRGRRPT